MHYVAEIVSLYHHFLSQPFQLDDEMKAFLNENASGSLLEAFKEAIQSILFTPEDIQQAIKETGVALGIKGKPLFMGIRIATTAEMHGPSLPHVLALLTKEKVNERLTVVIKFLRGES
jgi:glutamyl-tRNA synthetase/nondiscriminating glutamyl-tRNA synthetase